jgi:hypothetical protein
VEPVARRSLGLVGFEHRTGHQTRQQVQYVVSLDTAADHDRFGGLERQTAGEHRQATEESRPRLVQQVIGPVDRAPQGLMALQSGATPARKQPEPLVESSGDLRDAQRADAGSGQLDRQWHPIELPTDITDDQRVRSVKDEIRPDRSGALGKQAHRR